MRKKCLNYTGLVLVSLGIEYLTFPLTFWTFLRMFLHTDQFWAKSLYNHLAILVAKNHGTPVQFDGANGHKSTPKASKAAT